MASASWHETTHGDTAASRSRVLDVPQHLSHSHGYPENLALSSTSSTAYRGFSGQHVAFQNSNTQFPHSGSDLTDGRYELDPQRRSRSSRTSGVTAPGPSDVPVVDAANYDDPNQTSGSTVAQFDREDERFNSQPRKRQKPNGSRMSYPRRRALTACQICRIRKTKCDNQRPICGACSQLNVECVYQEQPSDLSSFDPASLQILDRLNYSIRLIEDQAQALSRVELLASAHPQSHRSVGSTDDAGPAFTASAHGTALSGHSLDETLYLEDVLNDNAATFSEALDVAANCSSGRVLQWPILDGYSNPNDITALFFEASTRSDTSQNRSSTFGRGVQQEDVSSLITEFLNHVHVKNPILDPAELKIWTRQMSEHGFGWDGPSCLVLIACALANLSTPFTLARPGKDDVSSLDARDYFTAEAYYTASRKRIGLLGNSVLATQCYFLIGVYEMYSLRPLPAWLSFNHACITFQAYLRTPSRHNVNSRSSRRLEQRLYWSCLKSECEMRDEIDLPPTGLAKVEYPDLFPSPPGGTPAPEEDEQSEGPGTLESMFQRSWYYYLSEIACRRIANRISHALYKTEPYLWHTLPLRRMQRIAEELDAQVTRLSENIPHPVAFEDEVSPDELSFMLQARVFDLRERIWRPFLYLAIHQTFAAEDQLVVFTYAKKALDLIMKDLNRGLVKHRHHGSWYGCRHLFTMSLLILAAVKSGKVTVPSEWRSHVELALTSLKYWETEAPDLQAARLMLVSILSDLDGENPPGSHGHNT